MSVEIPYCFCFTSGVSQLIPLVTVCRHMIQAV